VISRVVRGMLRAPRAPLTEEPMDAISFLEGPHREVEAPVVHAAIEDKFFYDPDDLLYGAVEEHVAALFAALGRTLTTGAEPPTAWAAADTCVVPLVRWSEPVAEPGPP
jgi:hypothetical protein